jgi:hypothetical protein
MAIPERCPVDPERARAFLLNNMPADEACAFEEHYITCTRCADILDATVLAMEQAAQRLRDSER